ncbi:apolipoprotein D-like [Chelonus insularis]|uniref:apolipoprotein D-like n=1 Tax=Chelonus insularis TaxID=460826 RepID=UPI00158D07DE|nr:apolipoprotein D-like [Chelonus insularis]
MLLLQLFVIGWSLQTIATQTAETGPCPHVKVVQNFNVEKFMGLWFELSRSLPNTYEPGTECVTYNYTVDSYDFIRIVARQFSSETRIESQYIGNATIDVESCAHMKPCGKMKVAYLRPDGTTIIGPLWVLAIDYNSFAVLWSCTEHNNGLAHSRRAWVISKMPHPPDSYIEGAQNVLAADNITDIEFERTPQHTFCSEYYRNMQE